MIESTVYADKICRTGFFHHIHFRDKISGSTHQEFSGFKPNLQFSALFIRMIGKCLIYFFSQQRNIRFLFTLLARHFKSAAQIDEFQVFKMIGNVK